MSKILVSPVAFNENVKLKRAINRFLKSRVYRQVDYLVVDDCSTDGTTEMIESFRPQGVMTLRHSSRQGVGAAIRTAIDYARKHRYDILVIMAGNDKDNPEEIPELVRPIAEQHYDVVQGSRYKGTQGIGGDMPLYRKWATRVHPFLFTLLTRRKMTDTTNGFRAIRLSILDDERINIHQSWLSQYELEPYFLYKAVVLGYRVTEVAVTKIYPPRKLGYTKMRPVVGWWSILKPLFYLALRIKK